MEEAELITGYHAEVEPARLGYGLLAFIRLTTPTEQYPHVQPQVAQRLPEIRECHHVTGGEAFILKVLATSIPHLESIIALLSAYGTTRTSMPDIAGHAVPDTACPAVVLSSPLNKHTLEPVGS